MIHIFLLFLCLNGVLSDNYHECIDGRDPFDYDGFSEDEGVNSFGAHNIGINGYPGLDEVVGGRFNANDSYDTAFRWFVRLPDTPFIELLGDRNCSENIVAEPATFWIPTTLNTSGHVLSMQIFFRIPSADNWIRSVLSVKNLGPKPVMVTIRSFHNLGSDLNTVVEATSDSDNECTNNDKWFVSSESSNPQIDVINGFIWWTTRKPSRLSSAPGSGLLDEFAFEYDIYLWPNQTRSVMVVATVNSDIPSAISDTQRHYNELVNQSSAFFDQLPEGLSAEIINFANKCGDGIVSGNETCDDGNTNGADGCSSSCKQEFGYDCPYESRPCVINPKVGPKFGPGQIIGIVVSIVLLSAFFAGGLFLLWRRAERIGESE